MHSEEVALRFIVGVHDEHLVTDVRVKACRASAKANKAFPPSLRSLPSFSFSLLPPPSPPPCSSTTRTVGVLTSPLLFANFSPMARRSGVRADSRPQGRLAGARAPLAYLYDPLPPRRCGPRAAPQGRRHHRVQLRRRRGLPRAGAPRPRRRDASAELLPGAVRRVPIDGVIRGPDGLTATRRASACPIDCTRPQNAAVMSATAAHLLHHLSPVAFDVEVVVQIAGPSDEEKGGEG